MPEPYASNIIETVKASRLLSVALVVAAAIAAPAASSKTPLPAKPEGTGSEPTAGGGVMAGKPFAPHAALALLDVSFDQLEIYLLPKATACNQVLFVQPPYIEVTVDTNGAPIRVGSPSVQNGVAFVQVDFHPRGINKFFSIQPGASVTFTRVDPAKGSDWHGTVTVKKQHFQGHLFSYSGTFAAAWCGKD